MRPQTALVVAATILLALIGAEASVETTCKAAANKDTQVDYNFCLSELSKDHLSSDADTWGLAKVAANMGVNNAYGAISDIEGFLVKPSISATTKARLERCRGLYDNMKFAFAGAYDEINGRNYAAGKEEVAKAISLAHQCDDIFVKAMVPSSLTHRSLYTLQIAIVCTAITNLIK